jgi:hypothetical protein
MSQSKRGRPDLGLLDAIAQGVGSACSTKCRTGMACWARPELISRQYSSTSTVMGMTNVPPVKSSTREAVSTTRGRHGAQCWKLSVAGRPGVMSISVSPTFSASNTRESGIKGCSSAPDWYVEPCRVRGTFGETADPRPARSGRLPVLPLRPR